MPKADQFDHNFPVVILFVYQDEVRDHHGISQEEHLTFTRKSPMSAFVTHLLLKLASKVCFKTAIERSGAFEMGTECAGVVEVIEHFPCCLRRAHMCKQLPAVAQQERGEKRGHLSAIAERRRHKRRNGAIQINAIAFLLLWLRPEHQFEEFDVAP